jgi:hypothetical protein
LIKKTNSQLSIRRNEIIKTNHDVTPEKWSILTTYTSMRRKVTLHLAYKLHATRKQNAFVTKHVINHRYMASFICNSIFIIPFICTNYYSETLETQDQNYTLITTSQSNLSHQDNNHILQMPVLSSLNTLHSTVIIPRRNNSSWVNADGLFMSYIASYVGEMFLQREEQVKFSPHWMRPPSFDTAGTRLKRGYVCRRSVLAQAVVAGGHSSGGAGSSTALPHWRENRRDGPQLRCSLFTLGPGTVPTRCTEEKISYYKARFHAHVESNLTSSQKSFT